MSGTKRTETVDHHRVDLSGVRRLGHTPLKDLIDLVNLEPATEEERLALPVVDPRISGEATDIGEGSATEEETGAGVGGGFGGGVEG